MNLLLKDIIPYVLDIKDKKIEGISDIRDETGKHGMRVVIELNRTANAQVVLNRLFAQTQLQITFAINMLALITRLSPECFLLKAFLMSI